MIIRYDQSFFNNYFIQLLYTQISITQAKIDKHFAKDIL